MIRPAASPIRRLLVVLAALTAILGSTSVAHAQQPANEIDAIKKDVEELQKLVREIEGRLFVLQQRLKRLPAQQGPTGSIDKHADLLKRVFASLTALRSAGKLKKGVTINVTVSGDGKVTLKGMVGDTDQLKLVLENVRRVPGVKTIVNEIQIREEIEKKSTEVFRVPKQSAFHVNAIEAIDEAMIIDALQHADRFGR